ncbi:MAG: hypothetical protein Q3Y08_04875, partial [Butyricicoccus sp.]|nr:hypothetical protein [Butyricicoccus sp.]
MKKKLAFLLAAALLATLAACGGNDNAADDNADEKAGASASQSADQPDASAPEEPTQSVIQTAQTNLTYSGEEGARTITLDPAIVLYEDENVTAELTGFYEEEVKWKGSDTPSIEKAMTLKVTNNSDREILFSIYDAYLEDESVKTALLDGNAGPAPGKSKSYSYRIRYETQPDTTPVDSLEQLFHLDGRFSVQIKNAE